MSEKSSIVDRIPAAGIVLVRRSRLVTSPGIAGPHPRIVHDSEHALGVAGQDRPITKLRPLTARCHSAISIPAHAPALNVVC